MPRRAREQRRQHYLFGAFLQANGLETQPDTAFPERAFRVSRTQAAQRAQSKQVIRLHLICLL